MKKRAGKTKPKSAAAKKAPKPVSRPASAHDSLHSLLRGAHAHRVCGQKPG